MIVFARECKSSGALRRLRSITLTVHQQLPMKEWKAGVIDLLSTSPLEVFQIYSTGAFLESPTTDDLWSQLILTHGKRLIRFSVHRMLISLEAIKTICMQCTTLEQLFIVVEPSSLVSSLYATKRSILSLYSATIGKMSLFCEEATNHTHKPPYRSPSGVIPRLTSDRSIVDYQPMQFDGNAVRMQCQGVAG